MLSFGIIFDFLRDVDMLKQKPAMTVAQRPSMKSDVSASDSLALVLIICMSGSSQLMSFKLVVIGSGSFRIMIQETAQPTVIRASIIPTKVVESLALAFSRFPIAVKTNYDMLIPVIR